MGSGARWFWNTCEANVVADSGIITVLLVTLVALSRARQRQGLRGAYRLARAFNHALTGVLTPLGKWGLHITRCKRIDPNVGSVFDCVNGVTSRTNYMLKVLLLQNARLLAATGVASDFEGMRGMLFREDSGILHFGISLTVLLVRALEYNFYR